MRQTDSSSPPRQRGRPAVARDVPLDREAILEQAMAIVQTEGFDALSMRRLARDLGVTPMAIYHHVPDKPALLEALIVQVWDEVNRFLGTVGGDDLVEFIVQGAVHTRRVWLEHLELAPLAMALAAVDDEFFDSTLVTAVVYESAGFPDPALAYYVTQTYTMGAVATTANRRRCNAYFDRDADLLHDAAHRQLDERGASPVHRALVENRFDEGDEASFEPGLRALLAGLLAAPQ